MFGTHICNMSLGHWYNNLEFPLIFILFTWSIPACLFWHIHIDFINVLSCEFHFLFSPNKYTLKITHFSGLCPSSGILQKEWTQCFKYWICYHLHVKSWKYATQMGVLERALLSHWMPMLNSWPYIGCWDQVLSMVNKKKEHTL